MTQAGQNSDRLMVQPQYTSFPFTYAKNPTTDMILTTSKMYRRTPFSEKLSDGLMLQNNISPITKEAWIISNNLGLLKYPKALLDYCHIVRIFFLIKGEIFALHLKKKYGKVFGSNVTGK